MANVLGVTVEPLVVGNVVSAKRAGPVGRMQKIFEEASRLPRRQQDKIIDVVGVMVEQYRRSG